MITNHSGSDQAKSFEKPNLFITNSYHTKTITESKIPYSVKISLDCTVLPLLQSQKKLSYDKPNTVHAPTIFVFPETTSKTAPTQAKPRYENEFYGFCLYSGASRSIIGIGQGNAYFIVDVIGQEKSYR